MTNEHCLSCTCTFSEGCRFEARELKAEKPVKVAEKWQPPPPGFVGIWPNAKGHKIRYPRPKSGKNKSFRQAMRELMAKN